MENHIETSRLALTDLSLCELLQGVRAVQTAKQMQREVEMFQIYRTCGEDLAIASADNYRFLRSKGLTIRSTIDCIIATFCTQQNYALLHRDNDFDVFEQHLGLNVVQPVN